MYFFLRLKPNILCSGNLCTFSSSYILGSCNGEGKGHSPNNIIDHKGLAVACDVMQLVTGVWSILIQALSELLGSLKEKKYGRNREGLHTKEEILPKLYLIHISILISPTPIFYLSLKEKHIMYVPAVCMFYSLSVILFVV